ncbi:type II secretion system F family protein [Amedibacillus sp. YH-ame10]
MAVFKYIARDMEANKIQGKREADDEKQLVSLLRSENLYLISFKDITNVQRNEYKMKLKELADYSRQLGAMLGSGVSLIRAISILLQREENPKIKRIYTDIYRKLQQGLTLSAAMEEQGKAFPELMINMYRSGEASGQMEKVAKTMAIQYEKDNRVKSKVKNAMVYPIILLCMTVVVIVAVFTLIIPQFQDIFEGMELPLVTRLVNAFSKAMLEYWYLFLIGVLMIIAIISSLLRVDKIRYKFDKFKLTSPLFGKLLRIIYTARFARNLCSLYTSGISIINALQIARTTVGNKYLESQFDDTITMVRNGSALSQSVQKIQGFDSKLSTSIFIGEESGKLEDMLTSIADDFDYESEAATQRMVTIMEPVMIIILAVIVLMVMLSVLLPIYQMYQNPTGIA